MTDNEQISGVRGAVFLISSAVIALELGMIRVLALRFHENLAWLAISSALLGFGISGTAIILFRRWGGVDRIVMMRAAAVGLCLSIPISCFLSEGLPLDTVQLAWHSGQLWRISVMELLLMDPFIFAGGFIGLAMEDTSVRIPGHYAANLFGSGAGGVIAVAAMYWVSPRILLIGVVVVVAVAALLVTARSGAHWRVLLPVAIAIAVGWAMKQPTISPTKDLPQLLAGPGAQVLVTRHAPEGRYDVLDTPAFHSAPGLSLESSHRLPPLRTIVKDGQVNSVVYAWESPSDVEFLNDSTASLPYAIVQPRRVLLLDAGGGSRVAYARYRGCADVTALQPHAVMRELMTKDLSKFSGGIYSLENVRLLPFTPRAFLQTTDEFFDLIELPMISSDPGGLYSTSPNDLLTREVLTISMAKLSAHGLLSCTGAVHLPPRENLRLLSTLSDMLREAGLKPERHIAVIRNWSTVTTIVSKQPLTADHCDAIRQFCELHRMDLVWLPGLKVAEVNRFHQLESAAFYLAADELLGPRHENFVQNYLFDIRPCSDDRPYFHRFARTETKARLEKQLGRRAKAHTELASLLHIHAVVQAVGLAGICILLPLVPAVGLPKSGRGRTFGFFAAIGLGYMTLEMGCFQYLLGYLAHPVLSAATVITGFLFFSGIGCLATDRFVNTVWRRRVVGLGIVVLGAMLTGIMPMTLAATCSWGLPARIFLCWALIAPVATLMGTMFPAAMQELRSSDPKLIPWAWGINGAASVIATLAAPLLAMEAGFRVVLICGLGCYAAATLMIGEPTTRPEPK